MLKIDKITVENFRGIRSPVIIDFVKGGNATSALIYGRNGTGKSSIIDAWEWLLNSKIEYLSNEGVSERDYAHKLSDGKNVYVNIDFKHSSILSAKASFNNTKISAPTFTGNYLDFKSRNIYPNYLRYSDLQEFVFKSKGEKYKYISKFFGLEDFTKNQTDIQTSLTRITNQLQQFKNQLSDSRSSIELITKDGDINDTSIVSFINNIGSKYKIETISEFRNVQIVEKALSQIIKTNPLAKEVAEINSFLQRINQFYPLPAIKQECLDLENVFTDLKADETNITNLILIELYESAKETISKLEDKSRCPVCDKVFEGDLETHISEKYVALKELEKKKDLYSSKSSSLIKKFQDILNKIEVIHLDPENTFQKKFSNFFDDLSQLKKSLPKTISELKTPLKDLKSLEINSKPEILKIQYLAELETTIKVAINDKLKALSADDESKNLALDFGNVIKLIESYSKYLKNEKKVVYLTGITSQLEKLFKKLTLHIQTEIQNTFTIIQADLIECYNCLESSNDFLKNPRIKLVIGKDKAVELEIEFINEKITPAYKFMSESQINSFGLAIFLAAVKHFNPNFKFFILDDVINSFDAFKRPKVAQLIAKKFNEFQVLILTHDQVFFDTVQKDFPQWNRYKFASWDYTTGPRCLFSNNYLEEIQNLIDDDDPIGAGQKFGRYLEMTFGIINENMQTPLRYKLENVYTLSEFYEPLVKRFKEKLKMSNRQHKISTMFDNFEQGTIFRNYCAHWKNESSQFTSSEIDTIFKKWLKIEAELYCKSCKSYSSIARANNNEHIKCNCGLVNLKDLGNYL
ncbi:AAA family ATPase [Dyadobacter diqingensis]|uniref:AAA family ATPase n=1 Tax=Dyadobacter diqingensis TaxID=2938121 RepID=UPI0020C1A259|nr:AAA family ATPase [Dyadobacter diqingensis]